MPYKKPTEVQWVALEKEMAEYDSGVGRDAYCYMGAIRVGKPIYVCDFGGCHAGLSYCENAHGIVNCIQPGQAGHKSLSDEMVWSYINYLLHDSPWSECYVEKDTDVVVNSTFVRVDTSKQSPLVIGACIALRYLTEHYKVAYNHYYLTQAGVQPDLALLIAYCITGHAGGTGAVGRDCSGHSCLYPGSMSIEAWKRFITHEEREDQLSFFNRHGTNGSIAYWKRNDDGDSVSFNTRWGEDIRTEAKKGGVVVKASNNPFDHAAIKRAVPYDAIIKAIGKMNKKILKEIGV